MLSEIEIQKEYLDKKEHSQKSKEKIADYINEAFIRGSWLAKKINDLKLPGVKGITYRVKSDYSIGAKVRRDRDCEWKGLPDFIGLTIVAPTTTYEYLPSALKKIRDLDFVTDPCNNSHFIYCYFMDFPVEIALIDYQSFALKQFDECVRWELGKCKPIKLDLPASLLLETINKLLDSQDDKKDEAIHEEFDPLFDSLFEKENYYLGGNNEYGKVFEKFVSIGRIIKGFGRFSICYPSDGTTKPVTVNFENGFACDSAFSLAFLTNPNYSRLLRFGILTDDDNLRDLAFMAYKGVSDGIPMSRVIDSFRKIQH